MMHQRSVVIAVFIFFLLALPSVWAGTVTRSMPGTVDTGSPLSVTLVVDVSAGETFYAIDEQYPSGWVVSDDDGMNASQPNHLKLANISSASDTSFIYTLTAPSSPGGYDWTGGLYMFEGMPAETSILGSNHVDVQTIACSSHSTQGVCDADASCQWCDACSGMQSFSGGSQCIDSSSSCSYSCTSGQCGAACGSSGDCVIGCDSNDGCYPGPNGRYRDYSDVTTTCQADCTCSSGTCSQYTTPYADNDGDGYDSQCGDCNDGHENVSSGAPEICDGIDNQCPGDAGYGQVDEGCDDDDDDWCDDSMITVGTPAVCPNGGGDFDDDSSDCAAVSYPGASEVCDNCDNNGDGTTDQFSEDCGPQNNTGRCVIGSRICSAGSWGLCSGAVDAQTEVCNLGTVLSLSQPAENADDDCNGVTDDVGGGNSVATTFCQCYDGGSPLSEEVCPHNNIDDDCNGAINDRNCGCTPGATQDCAKQDGVCSGSQETCPSGGVWPGCDDATYLSYNSSYNATGDGPCDGYDNNCDGNVDEGLLNTYYSDYDSDGFGNSTDSIQDCSSTPLSGYVDDHSDCNDNNDTINPAATEICDWNTLGNPIDNNCDNNYNYDTVPGDLGCAETSVTIVYDYYDGRTTNFSNVPDTMDIQGMILEKTSNGMIEFLQHINISLTVNLNPPFTRVEHNLIDVDSSALPFLDVPATLHLYSLDFLNPVIFMDGDVCPSSICEIIDYAGGNLTFNVTGFTEYSATGSCSDGTLYGECSSAQPRYCLNGSLVNRAGTCGCPSDYDRDGDDCVDNTGDGGGGGGGGGCTSGQQIACSVDGVCKPSFQTCVNGLWGTCQSDISPETEVCDGLDNDCDGLVDDGINCLCTQGDTRTCGPSTETGECKLGVSTCSLGQWGDCENEVMPSTELCDGLDNDCDGEVDEGCTNDVCSEGAIPSEGCLCGTEKMTSGFCCSGVFFEEGCPFAWSILIITGVIILIVLYILVYYFKTKGQELTYGNIKSRYASR